MIALLLSALLIPAASTWTVDDDGPADFAQISDALAEVSPGDVLLVEPGEYAGFQLTQPLTILGRAGGTRPHVGGLVRVTASSFTLAGLDLVGLRVNSVAGRGRVDDCRVNVVEDFEQPYAIAIDGCAELVISRTTALGSKAYSQSHMNAGGSPMSIVTSNVRLVDCQLEGAKGLDPSVCCLDGGAGGDGLRVAQSSHVLVAGSRILGGPEGWSSGFLGCHDGPSGAGARVLESLLVLRGAPADGDAVHAGWVDGFCTDNQGRDIDAVQSTVVISGVAYDEGNVSLLGSTLVAPAVPEPFIEIVGLDAPGQVRSIHLHGPAGATAVLAVSLAPGLFPLGAFDDALWLDPTGFFLLLPLVTLGQDTPVALNWTVPASTVGIAGVAIELQPFFPGLPGALEPGKSVAGNVAELIVRF
jgi:hypothetical protein